MPEPALRQTSHGATRDRPLAIVVPDRQASSPGCFQMLLRGLNRMVVGDRRAPLAGELPQEMYYAPAHPAIPRPGPNKYLRHIHIRGAGDGAAEDGEPKRHL